jgi:hypothetical protein
VKKKKSSTCLASPEFKPQYNKKKKKKEKEMQICVATLQKRYGITLKA